MAKGMSPVAKAVGADPKANVRQKPHTAGVGNETKADMKGAGVVGDSSLSGATADVEMLEDLIAAAFNEAGRRAEEVIKSSASAMLGGLNLPPGLF